MASGDNTPLIDIVHMTYRQKTTTTNADDVLGTTAVRSESAAIGRMLGAMLLLGLIAFAAGPTVALLIVIVVAFVACNDHDADARRGRGVGWDAHAQDIAHRLAYHRYR